MWLMPLLVVLFAVVEYVMFRLYNKLGHPWKVILEDSLEVRLLYDNGEIIVHISKINISKFDVKDDGWT